MLGPMLAGGSGAVFNFIAGETKRAPRYIQYLGMEWLYRLILNPKKLYRRYLVKYPKFMFLFIKHHLLGFPGSKNQEIKNVYSHAQGLSQCSNFIKKNNFVENVFKSTGGGAVKRPGQIRHTPCKGRSSNLSRWFHYSSQISFF